MKILHISDLHIGKEQADVDEWRQAEELVRLTTENWQEDAEKPLVLVTGDVVDDGEEAEFIEARRILRPLRSAGFEVVALPGNHDYGWNGAFARARKFELFRKYLLETVDEVTYPYVAHEDDTASVVVLNSMLAETGLWDGLLADGELGDRQIDALDELLKSIRDRNSDEYRIVVALHHHPFLFPDDKPLKKAKERFAHRLKDGDDLMQVISGRIDALLFGHEHRQVDFSEPFAGHEFTVEYEIGCILCSGKSTDPGLPARVITLGGSEAIRVEPAPWNR